MGREVEKTPVGISATPSGVALATKAQGWFLPGIAWPQATSRPIIQGVLGKALLADRTAPALVTRDTGQLVTALEEWLGEYDRNALLPNIVHDMAVLGYATGRPVAHYLSALKDALDCAVVGPGMALEAPRFYYQVGMPLVKHNAQPFQAGVESPQLSTKTTIFEGARWTLTYDWLLFRVLAYYTRDPTLTRWFQDGNNPLDMFGRAVELEPKEAVAFLLWMVCGEEEELVSRYYPDWAAHLPEAPQLIKASRVDKHLPALQLGLIRLTGQYATNRRAETLYSRRSPWGLQEEELLHFALMGSVHDLLDVCVASIVNLGSRVHWLVPEATSRYAYWLRASIVGYTSEEPMEWRRTLEHLGTLNNPLGMVPLEPKVVVE